MTRRLAAILVADVAGYSRLMQADESGTHAAFGARRAGIIEPLVRDNEGRIVKFMGDGFLVEFASAVNAVNCAFEIQKHMAEANSPLPEDRRIAMRIGINLGDVIAQGDDLFGDGVNVAARLEALAEPGGVLVSAAVFAQVRGKLALDFEEEGEKALKNIVEPVRVYRVLAEGTAPARRPAVTLPDKPSIAVLPFENMSGDADQEYFADGMVEEIITALSRLRWLFVIARNSSFVYKGRAADIKQVGRELGVRYVLEGSVRKAGNRVRITGQLIDASNGAHLWAERFEGKLEDIFDLQDQVTASVVGAIAPKLEQAEIDRASRKPTQSLDAYDCYLRATAAYNRWTKEANEEAMAMAGRAIERDPNFASAWAVAARCYVQRLGAGWIANLEKEVAEAERLSRRAIDLGKDDAVALVFGGFALARVAGDLEAGLAAIDRAMTLNPNFAFAWNASAIIRALLGEPERAIEHAQRAMRLSPQDPQAYGQQHAMALAHLFAGRPEEALSWAKLALREQPRNLAVACTAAVSAVNLGRIQEARETLAQALGASPAFSISALGSLFPIRRPEHFAMFAEGLRQAGLPE